MVFGNAEYINWAIPHTYFGMLIWIAALAALTGHLLTLQRAGSELGTQQHVCEVNFKHARVSQYGLSSAHEPQNLMGLRINNLVYVPDVINSLGSAFNFGQRNRVQKLTGYSLPISVTKPLPGMKQLLFIAYAARIKVSPQTHDIKESMLHSNLGHHLPSENASRMFKQMEQPMNQKPPQLGFEQRSSKQLRICMNATAPFPPTH